MIIILSLRNEQKSLKNNLNVLEKTNKPFSVPIKKEIRKIDKEGNKTVETISYKIKFIDGARFSASSLLNNVDNLTEGIHKIKCENCDFFPEYNCVKGNKCLSCNKCYSKKLNEEL